MARVGRSTLMLGANFVAELKLPTKPSDSGLDCAGPVVPRLHRSGGLRDLKEHSRD